MMRARFQSQQGSVLLVALCFVTVLGISLAGYVAVCSRTMQLSNRTAQTGISQQLAELGLEEALRAFNKNDWSDWSNGTAADWTLSGTTATCNITFPAGKFGQGVTGSAKIRVDNYNANQLTASWSGTASYRLNDLVGYSGMWYRCVTAHTNQTPTATGNLAYWVPAPIPWTWSGDITYSRHDAVNYGGIWYRCVPTTLTSTTIPSPTNTNWATIPTNVTTWSASTTYAVYDIVNLNGVNYRCIQTNTNQSPPDATYWSSAVNSISLSWSSGAVYTVGAIVYDNGSWYSCIANHTSGATLAGDLANWDSSDWRSSTDYEIGDIVYRSGSWYSCKIGHTSPATFATTNWNSAYWSSGSISYPVGGIAYYTANGGWYRCIFAHTSSTLILPTDTTFWKSAEWSSGTAYTSGEVVNYGGSWYSCATDHVSTAFTSDSTRWTLADPDYYTALYQQPSNFVSWQYLVKNHQFNEVSYYSTTGSGTWYRRKVSSTTVAAPTNTTYWENALTISWDWNSADTYELGDVVYRGSSFYRCILAHTNQGPPNATYWSTEPLKSTAWDSGKNYSQYDTVRYGGSWYLSLQNSNFGIPPGTETTYWAIAPRSITAWDSSKNYSIDDLVSSGGTWYRCIQDTTASQATSNTVYWVSLTGSAYQWNAATANGTSSYVNYGGVWYDCIAANTNQSPNNTTYWTALGAPVVYAEGTINIAGSGSTKTQLRATIAPASLFPNAVAASGTVTLGGAGTVDSYNASGGAYNQSTTPFTASSPNLGNSAVVASSYTTNPAISITTANVKGYLAAPSASTTPYAPLYSSGGTVKGASSPVSPNIDLTRISRSPYIPQFDIQTAVVHTSLPGTLPTSLNLGAPGAPTPSIYYDSSITIGTTVHINGPVILYINTNLLVNTGETIYINSTGSLVLYITNNTNGRLRVESASNGIVNRSPSATKPDPKNLVILADTTSTGTQYYSDTTNTFYGVIYMPNTTTTTGLTIASGVTIYGALSAKEITFSGASDIHYDTSLRHATITGVDQPYTIIEWRELTDATERITLP